MSPNFENQDESNQTKPGRTIDNTSKPGKKFDTEEQEKKTFDLSEKFDWIGLCSNLILSDFFYNSCVTKFSTLLLGHTLD